MAVAVPAAAGTTQAVETEFLLRNYREAVEACRPGDTSARGRLAQWRQADVLTVIERLARLRDRLPPDGYQPAVFGWSLRLIEAATLLNIELAIAPDLPRHQRDFSLNVARYLLDVLMRGEPPAEAERLTRAIGAVLQRALKVDDLRRFLPRAVRQFPDSPHLWLSLGSLHELTASQRLSAGREQHLVPGDLAQALRAAEAAYRRALSLEPTLEIARIRLGRVLYRQRRYADARAELQAVAGRPLTDDERYLTELFAAAVEDATRNWSAAIEAYRRAIAICSGCQVAQVGLARAYAALGDDERSRSILATSLRQGSSVEPDPWTDYDYAQVRGLPRLLADLERSLCTPH